MKYLFLILFCANTTFAQTYSSEHIDLTKPIKFQTDSVFPSKCGKSSFICPNGFKYISYATYTDTLAKDTNWANGTSRQNWPCPYGGSSSSSRQQ